MIKKYKTLILATIFLGLFFLNVSSCLAIKFEVPFLRLSESTGLPEYVDNVINLLFTIAGLVALFGLVIGGIRYMTSAGNPEAISDAMSRIRGSILGLFLVMASVLIARTINLALVEPKIENIKCTETLCFTKKTDINNDKDAIQASMSYPDTPSLVNNGYKFLYRKCKSIEPYWFLKAYDTINANVNWGGADNARFTLKKLECGQYLDITQFKSYKIELKYSGVYLCDTLSCPPWNQTTNAFPRYAGTSSNIFNSIESVLSTYIINDPASKNFYAAILHGENNLKQTGQCSDILGIGAQNEAETERPTLSEPMAITVFSINLNEPAKSGNGVVFYSRPFGPNKGQDAGKAPQQFTANSQGYMEIDPGDLYFDYTGVKVTKDEEDNCQTFADCPGAIEIKGDYAVVLYTSSGQCRVFYGTEALNMDQTDIKENLSKIIIVPLYSDK